MVKTIYLDNAATTKMKKRVLNAMLPFFQEYYGNPAGVYELGVSSQRAVEHAREQIADTLACRKEEIYFTSGGTESDNWALQGAVKGKEKAHIITTAIEHHAILNTCHDLEKRGIEITYLKVDEYGRISLEQLERAIQKDTVLISVMTANNEIGTIEPMEKIGTIAQKHGILFHTDAVQAYGHIPIFLKRWHVDLMSASAHKFHGPKGCGFLYIREGVELPAYQSGGSQERGRRAGTLNVPGIVGMGEAAALAGETQSSRAGKEREMQHYLIRGLEQNIPYIRLNGHPLERLPNNVNFSFQFIEGETLLILLDMNGICASAASACSAGSKEPSHVLTALGLPAELARGTLRLTLSADNTKEEMDRTIELITENVTKLREMSKIYTEYRNSTGVTGHQNYPVGRY